MAKFLSYMYIYYIPTDRNIPLFKDPKIYYKMKKSPIA